MKNLLALFLVFISFSAFAQKSTIQIPSKQKIEISYPNYDVFKANLKGQGKSIDVAVISKASGDQVKGFGLGKYGNADIMVEAENKLVLSNTSDRIATVVLQVEKATRTPVVSQNEYIEFTLRNNSLKSIPLWIPSVMNPNLNPKSNSGVSLKVGQKIYYKKGGKKVVLLEVDNSIQKGDVIEVSSLIKELKAS